MNTPMKTFVLVSSLAALVASCGQRPEPKFLPGAKSVRVRKQEPPEQCRELGPIEAIDGGGCEVGEYDAAYIELKNLAFEHKADYVRLDQSIPPIEGFGCFNTEFVLRGVAFRCQRKR